MLKQHSFVQVCRKRICVGHSLPIYHLHLMHRLFSCVESNRPKATLSILLVLYNYGCYDHMLYNWPLGMRTENRMEDMVCYVMYHVAMKLTCLWSSNLGRGCGRKELLLPTHRCKATLFHCDGNASLQAWVKWADPHPWYRWYKWFAKWTPPLEAPWVGSSTIAGMSAILSLVFCKRSNRSVVLLHCCSHLKISNFQVSNRHQASHQEFRPASSTFVRLIAAIWHGLVLTSFLHMNLIPASSIYLNCNVQVITSWHADSKIPPPPPNPVILCDENDDAFCAKF